MRWRCALPAWRSWAWSAAQPQWWNLTWAKADADWSYAVLAQIEPVSQCVQPVPMQSPPAYPTFWDGWIYQEIVDAVRADQQWTEIAG